MRPDVDSYMGKMTEMYTRSKFYDLKVGNLQEINKMPFPPDRYSNLFLNTYINHHVHAGYLKMIEFYSPLGTRVVMVGTLPRVPTITTHTACFFYAVLTPTKMKTLTTSAVYRRVAAYAYDIPAIRVNTGKATYTFTSNI